MNRNKRGAWWAATLVALMISVSSARAENPYPVIAGAPTRDCPDYRAGENGTAPLIAQAGPSTSPPPAALGESSVWPVPNPPPSGDMGLVPPQSQSVFSSPTQQIPFSADNRYLESAWYTRVDYFHWNEQIDGADFVNEYGTLITLGYCRTIGFERFRGEVFGGTMHYLGGVQFDDGTTEPFFSITDYIGLRAEYDLLFEPTWWSETTLFLGVGTRFWFRDLPGGTTASGDTVLSYQESWWTFYPYIGLEKRRSLENKFEFFSSVKIGIIPFTYEHVSLDDVSLHPGTGFMSQAEFGFRGRNAFLSAYFEVMTWSQSGIVQDWLQPKSTMETIGMRAGFSF